MCLLIAFSAEAVNNMGGLGFNGFDENGIAKWDRLTIVNVLRLEVLQYNITLSSILHVPCGCSDDDDGDGDYDDRSNCPDKPRIVDFVKISEYYQNDITGRLTLMPSSHLLSSIQFATNLKEVLDNWNICTALWLRR